MAFCYKHWANLHDAKQVNYQAGWDQHTWSLTEIEKEKLDPGDVYCIECKRRAAKRMCTTCWDPYCDTCFKIVHHIGMLKTHGTIAYRRARSGWTCIKGRMRGEQDYYVHGTTGNSSVLAQY